MFPHTGSHTTIPSRRDSHEAGKISFSFTVVTISTREHKKGILGGWGEPCVLFGLLFEAVGGLFMEKASK